MSSAMQIDVRDLGSIDGAVTRTLERYGRIDVLVNNEGVGTNHDALEVTEDDWDEVLDVNLEGRACRATRAQPRRRWPRFCAPEPGITPDLRNASAVPLPDGRLVHAEP